MTAERAEGSEGGRGLGLRYVLPASRVWPRQWP